jgi:hypothetical protein
MRKEEERKPKYTQTGFSDDTKYTFSTFANSFSFLFAYLLLFFK